MWLVFINEHIFPTLLASVFVNIFLPELRHKLLVFRRARKLPLTHTNLLLAPFQLSSVNSFLESINDYLRVKDEELALIISAQRVEGYEVEGINEEIDKVRYDFPLKSVYFVTNSAESPKFWSTRPSLEAELIWHQLSP